MNRKNCKPFIGTVNVPTYELPIVKPKWVMIDLTEAVQRLIQGRRL